MNFKTISIQLCAIFFLLFSCYRLHTQGYIQTYDDDYTRYELLDPTSQSFRILYDVTVIESGATQYFNTLRKGSEHIVDGVRDLRTGKELEWEILDGKEAKSKGHKYADPDGEYLRVQLERPVPENGELRIRIDKTYRDTTSYFSEGERIVFSRSLGIKRNAVALPAGYELVSCNYPSQLLLEPDGRIRLSFLNPGTQSVLYRIEARKLPITALRVRMETDKHPWPDYKPIPQGEDHSKARLNYIPGQRAFQDREIVYYMQQPETHSFRLYHDYTESRPGINKYLNVVRPGSKASDPKAYVLDTGEELKVETLRGKEISSRGIDPGEELTDDMELVVIWHPEVQLDQSLRLRIEETYTDPGRYLVYNDELIWDRSFGRNRNIVVLPEGWWLTANDFPARISQLEDGRMSLYFLNDAPGNADVFIKAKRR